MKIENNTILANENMILTNGNTYAKKVALGKYDAPENWHEITLEEYISLAQKEE